MGTAGFSAATASEVQTILDGNGVPFVAWRTSGGLAPVVHRWNGASWEPLGTVPDGRENGFFSLSMGPGNAPVVTFDGNTDLSAVEYSGSAWAYLDASGDVGAPASPPILGLTSVFDGPTLHVVRVEAGNVTITRRYFSGLWSDVSDPGIHAADPDIATDGNGTEYLAFRDKDNGDRLTVFSLAIDDWAAVGTAGFSAGSVVGTPSVAVNEAGLPCVAYADAASPTVSGRLAVKCFDGATWEDADPALPWLSSDAAYGVHLAIDEDGVMTVARASGDTDYPITVMRHEPTPPGFDMTYGDLVTTEAGGTATFTVALTIRPIADVTVSLSSDDTGEGTVSPASLTFTPANWSTPRTVTLTGVNDSLTDGNQSYTVVFEPAVSTDPRYDGLWPEDLMAVNLDDEATTGPIVCAVTNGGTPLTTGIWIDAWNTETGDYFSTSTASGSEFRLHVPMGVYEVSAWLDPDVHPGLVAPEYRTVFVTAGSVTPAAVTFSVSQGGSVSGTIQDNLNVGMAWIHVDAYGPFGEWWFTETDETGAYSLVLPPGTWEIVPWMSSAGYTYETASQTVTVTAGETSTAHFALGSPSLAPPATFVNDRTISGAVKDHLGNAVTGVTGVVVADLLGGGESRFADLQPNGAFVLNVPGGQWRLSAWLDNEACLPDLGRDDTADASTTSVTGAVVPVIKVVDTVTGRVLAPGGTVTTPNIRVWILCDVTGPSGSWFFTWDTISGMNGEWTLPIPSGTTEFWVGTGFEADIEASGRGRAGSYQAANGNSGSYYSRWPRSGRSGEIDLTLRAITAHLIGKARLPDGGPAAGASVSAFTSDGQSLSAITDASGAYDIPVAANITDIRTWTLVAGYAGGGKYYQSARLTFDLTSTPSIPDLALVEIGSMGQAATTSLKAGETQTLTLEDGLIVILPPGAMGADGASYLLSAIPRLTGLPDTSLFRVIGYGWEIAVKNAADGKPYTANFQKPAVVTMPYRSADLARAGAAETDLRPAYLDESSGLWVPISAFTRDPLKATITFQAPHFSRWALVSITPTAIPGDVNGVGGVTLVDAILALKTAAGVTGLSIRTAADVNQDQRIGIAEAVFALRAVALP